MVPEPVPGLSAGGPLGAPRPPSLALVHSVLCLTLRPETPSLVPIPVTFGAFNTKEFIKHVLCPMVGLVGPSDRTQTVGREEG